MSVCAYRYGDGILGANSKATPVSKGGNFLNLKNRVADEAIPLMRRDSGDEQQQKVMKR